RRSPSRHSREGQGSGENKPKIFSEQTLGQAETQGPPTSGLFAWVKSERPLRETNPSDLLGTDRKSQRDLPYRDKPHSGLRTG
ncbi:hypothetical protein, partial [Ensifer sp. NM-2]|uniref:hypothetical protein n=1 Tax=Ensifer sp. NM-2 TaxID=2109730 RepID=UPI001AED0F69